MITTKAGPFNPSSNLACPNQQSMLTIRRAILAVSSTRPRTNSTRSRTLSPKRKISWRISQSRRSWKRSTLRGKSNVFQKKLGTPDAIMPYQFKREPLTMDEANRLASGCATHEEKLIVWTLLDTGLRVAELANLTKDNLDEQAHRLMVYGKGGPFGTGSKRRGILRPAPLAPLHSAHSSLTPPTHI